MANIEELNLAHQVFVDITNLRLDLWAHTSSLLTQIQAGPSQAAVDVMIGQAKELLVGAKRRTDRINALLAIPAAVTALTNGLIGMGCTISSANSIYTTLKNGVSTLQTALSTATTATDLQNACTTFQTNVPNPISMW